MKKTILPTLAILLAIWLIWTPFASAQGNMPPDRTNMPHRPMDPPVNRRHHDGFDATTDRVNVSGSIEVSDSITLALTIQPSEAMMEHMASHRSMPMTDFQNTISVSLTQLVEYEDNMNDGLTSDDLIVSTYSLNDDNLENVIYSEIEAVSLYTITSKDESFVMLIEINSTNDMPHDWKWSLVMQYNFQSNSSKLAVLHDISIGRGNLIREDFANASATPEAFDRRELSRSHPRAPMFFRWDATAMADNFEIAVQATKFNDSFSLSFLQGEIINYDPSIGVSQVTIEAIDFELGELFTSNSIEDFIDQITSPSLRAVVFAVMMVSIIAIVTLIKKMNSN